MSVLSIVAGTIMCALSLFYAFRGEKFMGRSPGGDFAQFYVASQIIHEYGASDVYDPKLQADLYHSLVPTANKGDALVFASAPWLTFLFWPLTVVSYPAALCIWLGFSFAMFAASLLLLSRSFVQPEHASVAFLLAASWPIYVFETWIGGQVSIIAFLGLSLFLVLRKHGHAFLAGCALAILTYKPPLVVIPVLMLLIGREWRLFSGFCAGAVGFAGLSLAAVGWAGLRSWIEVLIFLSELTASSAQTLRRIKYTDLSAFFHLLLNPAERAAQAATVVAVGSALILLAIAWSRSHHWGTSAKDLLLAATFSWTLILNIYVPVYDTLIIIAAAMLLVPLQRQWSRERRREFTLWLVLLYIVPWISQSAAEFLRVQIFTLVLAGFGFWALDLARKSQPQPG